jgi:MMP 1-O-methyltransferase
MKRAAMQFSDVIDSAMRIPAWTQPRELDALALTAMECGSDAVIVEVGAFMGRATSVLASTRLAIGGGKVHVVDPFDGSGDEYSLPHYRALLKESGNSDLYEVFERNLRARGLGDFVQVHRCTGQEAARLWSTPVDLLLLDADQSVFEAQRLYDAWAHFLKAGGTVVLFNTADRTYAHDHDGYRRIAAQRLLPPLYENIRRVESLTFATKSRRD